MANAVKPATRLDVVVKLRERDEEQARTLLANSERAVKAAAAETLAALERARKDLRVSGSAADWQLLDAAHGRALVDAAAAAQAEAAAHQRLSESRVVYSFAYQRAETIRRIAETRRTELINEAEAKERKELDELGVILHGRD